MLLMKNEVYNAVTL